MKNFKQASGPRLKPDNFYILALLTDPHWRVNEYSGSIKDVGFTDWEIIGLSINILPFWVRYLDNKLLLSSNNYLFY